MASREHRLVNVGSGRVRAPHPKGIRVLVKRDRDRWIGYAVEGVIDLVIPRPSGACGYIVCGDDGEYYDIRNTKDIVPIWGN